MHILMSSNGDKIEVIYETKFYGTRFIPEWSDLSLEPRNPTWYRWNRTNLSRRNQSVDRIWDRECGNGREGEANFCCINCFGGLAESRGETVRLEAGCGGVCCENVIWCWSKYLREYMNELLRVQKWEISRSSLVKISAQLIFMETCLIWTMKPSCWNSRTKFSQRLRCLRLFVVVFWAQSHHERLSL